MNCAGDRASIDDAGAHAKPEPRRCSPFPARGRAVYNGRMAMSWQAADGRNMSTLHLLRHAKAGRPEKRSPTAAAAGKARASGRPGDREWLAERRLGPAGAVLASAAHPRTLDIVFAVFTHAAARAPSRTGFTSPRRAPSSTASPGAGGAKTVMWSATTPDFMTWRASICSLERALDQPTGRVPTGALASFRVEIPWPPSTAAGRSSSRWCCRRHCCAAPSSRADGAERLARLDLQHSLGQRHGDAAMLGQRRRVERRHRRAARRRRSARAGAPDRPRPPRRPAAGGRRRA